VAFALIGPTLKLPYSILCPASDTGAECAAEASEVDEESQECDIDDCDEYGEGHDKGEAEDINIAGIC
jgi:hypothetical protein